MPKSSEAKLKYMSIYQKTAANVEKRVDRNRARRHAIAAGTARVGDSKDIDHKNPLRKGGSDADSNTRVLSRAKNRGWRAGQTGKNSYD